MVDFIKQQRNELSLKRKNSAKSALKFGALCGGMIILVVEAILELEGKDPNVNVYPVALACLVAFFTGFLLHYLYSQK